MYGSLSNLIYVIYVRQNTYGQYGVISSKFLFIYNYSEKALTYILEKSMSEVRFVVCLEDKAEKGRE